MQNLLTTAEASSFLGCSTATLIAYAVEGKIEASFTMRRWKFTKEALDAFVVKSRRGR